jgi:hypothetical protein
MRNFLVEYGSETAYLKGEGKILSELEIRKYINDYLTKLGIKHLVVVNFTAAQVAPTSVTHDQKTGISKLNIKVPCSY